LFYYWQFDSSIVETLYLFHSRSRGNGFRALQAIANAAKQSLCSNLA